MKKLTVMFAALLASVSMFASKEVAPKAADLANYYDAGQLCVAVYFEEEVCNDVVFIGSYNGWSEDPTTMTKFEPVDNFEGWWVVAVTDESETIQGKPVQLKKDGSFSWDYQTGDADSWTLVSGTVTISAGYSGEANLEGYSTAEPVVLVSAYFKNHNSPCVAATPGTTLPLYDFESASTNADWVLVNGTQTNQWTIGSATALDSNHSLYISNNGSDYGYNNGASSVVWAYINTPITGDVNISFDWKGYGEGNYD